MNAYSRPLCTAAALTLLACSTPEQTQPPLTADDLLFSVENMDRTVDPRADFQQFAAGGWLSRAQRPPDLPAWGFAAIQQRRIKAQLKAVIDDAVRDAATAPKGSPTQLVGDFYTAYMDTTRIDAQGMAPLQGELDRIAAIASLEDLARYAGHFQTISGGLLLFGVAPQGDLADGTRYAIYAGPGSPGLSRERDVYSSGEDAPRRRAYRAYVTDLLKVAGYDAERATRVTDLVLEIETELDAAKFTDTEKRDYTRVYNPITFSEFQAQIPNVDLDAYMEALGLAIPDTVVQTEPKYYPVLSRMLDARPLEDFREYAAFLVINRFSDLMSTAFEEPRRARDEVFQGVSTLPPREERAQALLAAALGHPFSRLYVDATYDEATGPAILEMVDEILAAFRERIPTRTWLSEQTRAEALAKLDAFDVAVGHPTTWIDYSGVDIVADDPVANMMSIVAAQTERLFARASGPVVRDAFSEPSTLPIAMNAAYNFQLNGFEITAAIAQAPAYQADADPAVRFCTFGGIIGHETTHGFDTSGSQFDDHGNLRNWWTPEDRTAFLAEAKKLVDQANETEIVDGHTGNGAYWLPEDMADVGGITLGHAALMKYLATHPDENVEIDGLTQEQRCFVAWAQLWAEQATDEYLINIATSGNHPPNTYRTTAPLQHVDAFYEAFGIREGDPMWLPPEKRVHAW